MAKRNEKQKALLSMKVARWVLSTYRCLVCITCEECHTYHRRLVKEG